MENFEEKLQCIYKHIYYARMQYEILVKMLDEYDEKSEYRDMIICMIDSLTESCLIKLGRIYQEQDGSITLQKILNIIRSDKEICKDNAFTVEYAAKRLEEIKNSELVNKIRKMRNRCYAHIDQRNISGILSLNKDEVLNMQELNDLIKYTFSIVEMLYKIVLKVNILNYSEYQKKIDFQYESIKLKLNQQEK